MCARDYMNKGIGHMTLETFKEPFKEFTPNAIKLNWRGEPLLNPNILKMIRYAKERGVKEVLLNTNGLLLHQGLIHSLAWAGLDWLIFSVDGATRKTYEKIRKGGDWERLVKNIIATNVAFLTIEKHPKIRIQICKQPANEHEIEDWKKLFAPYADQLRIGNLYNPQGKRDYEITQPISCKSLWQRLTIDWRGNVYPCPGDFLGKVLLGNVAHTSIYQMWHSKEMNGLRKAMKSGGRKVIPLCEKCTSYCG